MHRDSAVHWSFPPPRIQTHRPKEGPGVAGGGKQDCRGWVCGLPGAQARALCLVLTVGCREQVVAMSEETRPHRPWVWEDRRRERESLETQHGGWSKLQGPQSSEPPSKDLCYFDTWGRLRCAHPLAHHLAGESALWAPSSFPISRIP